MCVTDVVCAALTVTLAEQQRGRTASVSADQNSR